MEASAPQTTRQVAETILLDPAERGKLFRYAHSRFEIGSADAEDLLQETALELLRQRAYVRSPESFVFTVFRARCARFVSGRAAKRRVFSDGAGDAASGAEGVSFDWMDRRLALREALEGVSSSCRRLLHAHYVEGESLRESARRLSLASSTVPKAISRCLKKLRACLA
jgi:RNA polymerase sigma factor (sigma-70 family)